MRHYPKYPRWVCPDPKCGSNQVGHQLFTLASDWKSSKPVFPCTRCGKARILIEAPDQLLEGAK